MHFETLVDEYIAERSPVVVDGARSLVRGLRRIRREWSSVDINRIGQIEFDQRAEQLLAIGAKHGTVRQELNLARAVLNFGARRGLRSPVPRLQLPASTPTLTRTLSVSEANRLVQSAVDAEILNFIAIALSTGARIAAIAELTWRQIDFEKGEINFHSNHPRAERQKGRPISPMTPVLAQHLSGYHDMAKPGLDTRVCLWGPMKCYFSFMRTAARAGLGSDVTPNTLRHTAAANMIRAGPMIFASRALGHRNLSTTELVYSHIISDDLRPAALALNKLLIS